MFINLYCFVDFIDSSWNFYEDLLDFHFYELRCTEYTHWHFAQILKKKLNKLYWYDNLWYKKKGEKKEHAAPKTSILDLPLIDILVPREAKKVEKEKTATTKKMKPSKEKKQSKSKKTASDGNTAATVTVTAASAAAVATTSSTVAAANKPKEIDMGLFRGLDPDRISTEISDRYKSIEVKGTSVELNQPDVDVFVEKTVAVPELKVKEADAAPKRDEPKKHQHEPEPKPVIIDLPTIIDIERPKQVHLYFSNYILTLLKFQLL